eukprot:302086-Chlamydomonas_euryale.AAC.1
MHTVGAAGSLHEAADALQHWMSLGLTRSHRWVHVNRQNRLTPPRDQQRAVAATTSQATQQKAPPPACPGSRTHARSTSVGIGFRASGSPSKGRRPAS